MTISTELFRLVAAIRDTELQPVDRELLRPLFAAFDSGQVTAVPERVIARVRDIHARMPKSK